DPTPIPRRVRGGRAGGRPGGAPAPADVRHRGSRTYRRRARRCDGGDRKAGHAARVPLHRDDDRAHPSARGRPACAADVLGGVVATRATAAREPRRRGAHERAGHRSHRGIRPDRRRGNSRRQRVLGSGRRGITARRGAGRTARSRRSRDRGARLQCAGSPGDPGPRRPRPHRAGWQTRAGCCARRGPDAQARRTRAARGYRGETAAVVPLPGQGQPRHDRSCACSGRDRRHEAERLHRVVRLGLRAHPLPDRLPQPPRRNGGVGLVLHLVQARHPTDHGQPRDGAGPRAGERMNPWGLVGVAVMIGSLFLTPLGLPGNWIMIAVLAVGAFFGGLVLLAARASALAGELIEFWSVKRYNLRYGGSNRAFWGALAGGLIGTFVGIPVPIIGSIIAGIIGSFVGAMLITMTEARTLGDATRVGWGVMLGRVWSAVAKTAAGVTILALGGWALLF